ncbi:uncharacterized protein LOC129989308 [Argiope bruennichi]|uniref:DDB1- and CUL4-associated factor 4-like n=1 Tax=Argiope bruennichi TaxID=94029 RepID=A0A8T0EG90_ARGBR|nr:uncharacterized protein LOC129989308 [Argiope bruennichi]KAF8772016.1 DDB1- and CUL4-associated factor 4-like [Argiope bruennichi]
MTDIHNIHTRRAGILDLIFHRERGSISSPLYKTSITDIKVNQLPRFSEQPNIYSDYDNGFYWCFIRSALKGDLVGVGWSSNRNTRVRQSSVCVFQFDTCRPLDEGDDVSASSPYINEISKKYSVLKDMIITDTADLHFRNQTPLLIVGNFNNKRRSAAILTSFHCDYVHPAYEWRIDDPIFCCASQMKSENYVLGCLNGFYICKDLRLSKKYHLEDDVIAADFNNDGNLLFISRNQTGIQLCDLRENTDRPRRSKKLCIREPALDDSSFVANRMKLLSDQITLIVSDKIGHLSKIDLRMKKSVFQYTDYKSFQYNRPLNIDEDLDLFCAVGNDNYCRIWSLSSGKLHWSDKIPPANYRGEPLTAHACILSTERRWFVAIIQNDTVTPIVPDEVEMISFQPESALR